MHIRPLPRLDGLPRPEVPAEPLHCTRCLAELPLDAGLGMEMEDYVHYFCGLDCLASWHELRHTLNRRTD